MTDGTIVCKFLVVFPCTSSVYFSSRHIRSDSGLECFHWSDPISSAPRGPQMTCNFDLAGKRLSGKLIR